MLNIPLDHIVVDELHLMLRVTDILIENLVNECLDWDREDDLNKKKGEAKGAHLKNLIQVIRSCGVSFDVWEQKKMLMGKPVADMTRQASWDLTRRSCWLISPVN